MKSGWKIKTGMFKSVDLNSLKETHHVLYLLQSQMVYPNHCLLRTKE